MVAAALGVLALAFGPWFAIRPANDSGQDLPIYEEYASMVLDGQMPYRDFLWSTRPLPIRPGFV
jgi:hypothetical protein